MMASVSVWRSSSAARVRSRNLPARARERGRDSSRTDTACSRARFAPRAEPRTSAERLHKLLVSAALQHARGVVLLALGLVGQDIIGSLDSGEPVRVAALVRVLLRDQIAVLAPDLRAGGGVAARRREPESVRVL